MMDYYGYFWSILVYFGLVPGLIGAGILGVRAWLKGAPPARIWLAALKGFVLGFGLSLVLIVVFLGY